MTAYQASPIGLSLIFIAVTPVILLLARAIYNVWLHPLARYPGPRLWAVCDIPWILMVLGGRPHEKILDLHQEYGDVVRIAPNELSFINPEAWREIMTVKPGSGENNKDPNYVDNGSIVSPVNKSDHSRMRKVLGDGFSSRAIAASESMLHRHIDCLLRHLNHESGLGKGSIDLVDWYNYLLIDVVYEMTFGHSFGCLNKHTFPPCVDFAFSRAKLGTYYRCFLRIPGARSFISMLTPKAVVRESLEYQQHVRHLVLQRADAREQQGDDLVGLMCGDKREKGLTLEEICTNAEILIIGGSETTASALCSATYLLASHDGAMAKCQDEIFSAFESENDINMASTSGLQYLSAVINESLRLYPPAPVALPRKAPPGGGVIFNNPVPEGTILGIWQWAAYHSHRNFDKPFEFCPERWLESEGRVRDRHSVFRPFSYGPRNCIGQNLALSQLHVVLARMLWNFEIKMAAGTSSWLDQDVFTLWQKKPLQVHLIPRASISRA